uniref:Uncharacterized protein n=1 Tax=Arundo donax TaxID=35708 RepID=A0A0A9EGM1_ARUDO
MLVDESSESEAAPFCGFFLFLMLACFFRMR